MVRKKFLKAKAVILAVVMALQSFGMPVHAQTQTGLNGGETATVSDLAESAPVSELGDPVAASETGNPEAVYDDNEPTAMTETYVGVSEDTTDGVDVSTPKEGEIAGNDTAEEYASSGRSSEAKLSMKELADLYEGIGSYSTLYKTAPVISGSGYKPSVLTNDAYNYVKRDINYYRTVAGLGEISLTDELNTSASWGALVLAMNKVLSHTPSKPADMSQEDYTKGYSATSSSNISYAGGYSETAILGTAIRGQIADSSSSSNVECLGHRRWLLKPGILTMGVGSANNGSSYYTDVRVFGSGVSEESVSDYDFIAWPASGNNLSDTFATSTPWSVTLNPSNYSTPDRSSVTVKVESVTNKTTWTFNSGTSTSVSGTSDYFNVNTSGYGVNNCIIFRPAYSSLSAFSGDYIVTISGIKDKSGNATTLKYKVTFDTYENASRSENMTISLNETEKTLYVGETLPLTVTIDPPEAGVGKTITWSSSNENVATVNGQSGLVTAVGKGEATITAAVGKSKVSCKVTVVNPVAGVTFHSTALTLHVGQTVNLPYKFTPEDAAAKNISLQNGNTTAVSAELNSTNGYVKLKALSVGTSTVTLNVDGYAAQCAVTTKDTITLKYQDGTGKEQLVRAIVGTKLSALANISPEREGYTFAGWYTSPGGKGNKVTADTTLTNQFVLYAYWKLNETVSEDLVAVLVGEQDLIYTGQALKPGVIVFAGEKLLQEKKDYTVSYKNNKNAYTYDGDDKEFDATKAPTIIITGKGIYSEKVNLYFNIQPKDIADPDVDVQEAWLKYNGKVQQKAPTVTYNKKKLSAKDVLCLPVDASIVLSPEQAYKTVGDYKMVLQGQGNFTGVRDVTLHIYNPKELINLGKVTIPKVTDKTYTGDKIELTAEELAKITMKVNGEVKTLEENVQYTIEYRNNTDIGTATAIISPISGKSYGSKKISYKITGIPLKTADVTGIVNKTYRGSEQVQEDLEVRISGSDGAVTKLTEGTDYKAIYTKNISAGTATLTIRGMGLYTGSIKKTFKILPYDLSLAGGGASEDSLGGAGSGIGSAEFIIAGESIGSVSDWASDSSAPVVRVPYLKGGCKPAVQIIVGEKTLTEGTDYTVKYSNNKAVTTDVIASNEKKMPTITIKGKGGYKGTITKTFTIDPKSIQDVVIFAPAKAASQKAGAYLSRPVLMDDDGKVLKEGTDYVIKGYTALYADGTTEELDKKSVVDQVGTVITVTVEGKGAYAGADQTTTDYEITAKALTGVKVSAITKPYTGSAVELDETDFKNADGSSKVTCKDGKTVISLTYGEDFEIIEGTYVSNTKIGTASVRIRGLGEYGGVATVKYKVGRKSLLGLIWSLL